MTVVDSLAPFFFCVVINIQFTIWHILSNELGGKSNANEVFATKVEEQLATETPECRLPKQLWAKYEIPLNEPALRNALKSWRNDELLRL